MSYLDKIKSSIVHFDCEAGPDMTVPHQAFTPRDILRQFVINDVQVQSHVSSDNISVNDPSESMDTSDIESVFDSLQEFEDDFDAREATSNQVRYVRKRKKVVPKSSEETPPKKVEEKPE